MAPGASQSNEVVEANQRFYDKIADVYDQADSRRDGKVDHSWVDELLKSFNPEGKDLAFCDAGAGSGFLSYRAQAFFKSLTLIDISPKMLDRIDIPGATKICADCSQVDLPDETFDVIGAFATLHHLFEPKVFFKEAFRLLKPGGLLYTDHDIEKKFVRHFQWPLKLYRAVFDHGHKYLSLCPEATQKDYLLSEYHGDSGLDILELEAQLKSVGFEIRSQICHWDGMGPVANIVDKCGLTNVLTRRGLAPVLRFVAVKPQ